MKISETVFKFEKQAFSHKWEPTNLSKKRVDKIVSLVGTGCRVLDVGCYDGTISKAIEKNGNQVIGIDISPAAVKLAKKKGIEAYIVNLEKEKIPKTLGKFDVVVAGEIIEHIFDTDSFIKKLSSALRPSGFLILTTPNLAGLGSRLSLLLGKMPWMIESDIQPGKSGHIRYFTFEELAKLLSRNGFKVIKLTTDSVGLGNLTVPFLDKLFPTIGQIIIVKAQKI
jgi:2-polyprenyl-3-methyl-5-hydroxy-6-metoxy-1,4-benzoquinol methylase